MKNTLFLIAISTLIISCQKKNTAIVVNHPENIVMERHTQRLKDFSSHFSTENRDLLIKIGKDVVAEKFSPETINDDIEKAKKYYDDLSIGYFSIVQETKYSLDSIVIKNNYIDKRKFEIENIKSKLFMLETLITRIRIETVLIAGKYKSLLEIREKCQNEVNEKKLNTCREEFDSEVMDVNKHIDKLNEIEKEIGNLE